MSIIVPSLSNGTMSARSVTILGSTGSIGVSTLNVIQQMGGRDAFDVKAVTGSGNIGLLAEQAKAVGAQLAVTADDLLYPDLKTALAGSGIEVAAGRSGLIEAAE